MSRVINRLRFIEPQLASPVDQPPEGKQWIHEIKYDGFRCQLLLERGWARVFTRNGHDWSDRYSSIVRAASNLRCRSAIIDGEAIVQDGNGASDFDALNSAMRWHPDSIILYAFDLMHLDGTDLRQQSLSVRRSILQRLIIKDEKARIQFSEEFVGDGAVLFKACTEHGLEGIVSKLATAPYPRVALRLGSRPSASPNPSLSLSGGIATAKLERLELCSRTLTVKALIMPGQHLSP